jgi:hypothetical protein
MEQRLPIELACIGCTDLECMGGQPCRIISDSRSASLMPNLALACRVIAGRPGGEGAVQEWPGCLRGVCVPNLAGCRSTSRTTRR